MADFTLNAPGTTSNPWSPANVIVPVSAIASQASPNGWRAGTVGVNACFAHDAAYGLTITTTARILTTNSSDDILIGCIARSGANAGVFIGYAVTATGVFTCTANASGTASSISTTVANTRTIGDVYSCTVSLSGVGGTATITGNVNGGSNFAFSANTTTTNTGETTLAAGVWFLPQNSNTTRLDLFTGTGISGGGSTVKSLALLGVG